MEDDHLKRLQQRRFTKAKFREHAKKRAQYGESILRTLNHVLRTSFSVSSLSTAENQPVSAVVPARVEDAPGLVAAYISNASARQLLTCSTAALGGDFAAEFWFDEKRYMGLFYCHSLRLPVLVEVAKALEDRVYVSPSATSGILVVDYYPQAWSKADKDFTILAQGADLESRLEKCFHLRSASALQ